MGPLRIYTWIDFAIGGLHLVTNEILTVGNKCDYL